MTLAHICCIITKYKAATFNFMPMICKWINVAFILSQFPRMQNFPLNLIAGTALKPLKNVSLFDVIDLRSKPHISHLWFTLIHMLSSNQVRERSLPLLRESQSLLPPLEEMEKNITGFYQALEKASHITSTADSEGPVDFKQKCQVTNTVSIWYHTSFIEWL